MRTNHQTRRALDKIDRNILRILQADGRISFTELGNGSGSPPRPAPNGCGAWSARGSSWATTLASARSTSRAACWSSSRSAWTTSPATPSRSSAGRCSSCPMCWSATWYPATSTTWSRRGFLKWLRIASSWDILLKLPHVRESKSYIVMEEVKESLSLPIPD